MRVSTVMERNRYGWTRATDIQRANVLEYTFCVPETETACWTRVECNGESLLTALLFSSSYDAPTSTACVAQLTKRCNPSQTDGSLRYASLHVRAVGERTEATISVTQVHPHGQESADDGGGSRQVPVNCQGLSLPSDKFFASRLVLDNFEAELQQLLVLAERYKPDCKRQCVRMNHSAIDDDVANTKLSVVTAGHMPWEDMTSSAYARTIRAKQLPGATQFVVCTSNRIWHENGGDPDYTVCCLKQSCVDQINKTLPLLRVSAVRERAMRLIRSCITGPALASLSDLVFCCEDADSVLSPTVLLRKPTRGKVAQRGALRFESSVVLLDTQIETEILDNPSLFGDTLLLRFQTNDSVSLQPTRAAMQTVDVPRPLRRVCTRDAAIANTVVPIVVANPSFGRCSTRLKAHALCDFVCAIDLTDSHLLTQQTCGNTYETQATLRPEHEREIRARLLDLQERYKTFSAFSRLVGGTAQPKCLALVETDTGNVVSSVGAVQKQLGQIDTHLIPDSPVGKQIYESLQQAASTFVEACAPFRRGADAPTDTQLAPLRHSKQLGRVQRICMLASGTCNSPTNNRALLLVHTYSPPDVSLLFIDRHLGTDPEYFSSDLRMDTAALHKASSVRAALGLPSTSPFCVQAITRLSSGNTNVFTNKNGTPIHGKQHALFSVRWKVDLLADHWNESTFSAFSANRVRTDNAPATAIGRVVTVTTKASPAHSAFNPNWAIRLIHTRQADCL